MYYILLQLKTKGRGIDCEPKGSVWSTSLSKKTFPPGDSLEQFLEREKAEVLTTVKSYKEVQSLMEKWHRFVAKNPGDVFDLARNFFNRGSKP